MLEKECNLILQILRQNLPSGCYLYSFKREIISSLGMKYLDLQNVIAILKEDKLIDDVKGMQYINETGQNFLANGGYSSRTFTKIAQHSDPEKPADSNSQLAKLPIQEAIPENEEYSDLKNGTDFVSTKSIKLIWLGKPAQFGYIIQELIDKGYLKRPTSSFKKDADIYLQLFEVDTTASSLAKEISSWIGQNSLSSGNRKKFNIPHTDKLIIPPIDELK